MSDNKGQPADPLLPPTADTVIRYQNALKTHLQDKETKYTVKTRENIDSKLTEQSEFQEQTIQLKKAFPPVVIMLTVFMIVLYMFFPQYMLPGLLLFPLFMVPTFFITRRSKKPTKAKPAKTKPIKSPLPLPPPLSIPSTSPSPPPPLPSTVPAEPKSAKPKYSALTVVLLAVSTLACALVYFFSFLLFLPFFAVLLVFYAYFGKQLKKNLKFSQKPIKSPKSLPLPPPQSPSPPLSKPSPKPSPAQPRWQRFASETLTGFLLATSTVTCLVIYFLRVTLFLPFFAVLLVSYSTYLVQVRFHSSKQVLDMPRTEQLILAVKDQKCYKCGSTEKDVSGNIKDGQIQLTCKKCGTQTIWKPSKADAKQQ